jgi:hypothetical protein
LSFRIDIVRLQRRCIAAVLECPAMATITQAEDVLKALAAHPAARAR